MWQIMEHRRVDKQSAAVPQEILKRYEKWKESRQFLVRLDCARSPDSMTKRSPASGRGIDLLALARSIA